MRRARLVKQLIGGLTAIAAACAPAWASSHREAPFISKNPKVDGTDFYMFNSYETGRAGYVTLLANYIPLEDVAGAPNFFTMDPAAIYEIHVDNTGDGVEDLTFQFQFSATLANSGNGLTLPIGPAGNKQNIAIPFSAVGSKLGNTTSTSNAFQNVLETYKVNLIAGPRRTGTVTPITSTSGAATFGKPLDNIGTNSIGSPTESYAQYAATFISSFDMPGCTPTGVAAGTHGRIFVGQRQEGFAVNLGGVFDTLHFTAGANTLGLTDVIGPQQQNLNDVGNKNVTTIAIEVPASCLVKTGSTVVGAWSTASVRQARVINPTATFGEPTREGGPFVQVSRLGMPLVNELIIGLPDKDRWNSSEPKDDAQWDKYFTNPTLPFVVAALFGGAGVTEPQLFPRGDLEQIFNTGIKLNGINVTQISGTPASAEMLRLNTAFGQPAATAQNSALGALGCFDNPTATPGTIAMLDPVAATHPDCDTAGFPNGRRPGDDVVDIVLRAAQGALIDTSDATSGGCLHRVGDPGGPTAVDAAGPGGCLPIGDGAATNATTFLSVFPYLNSPLGAQ